jgi:hypothetical protein
MRNQVATTKAATTALTSANVVPGLSLTNAIFSDIPSRAIFIGDSAAHHPR